MWADAEAEVSLNQPIQQQKKFNLKEHNRFGELVEVWIFIQQFNLNVSDDVENLHGSLSVAKRDSE